MDAQSKQELQDLQELEGQNLLDDSQITRLAELRNFESQIAEEAKQKEFQSAIAQKEHWRTKASDWETKARDLEAKLNQGNKGNTSALEPEKVIEITSALGGLDQRQQEFLLQQHKMSNKPLSELRNSEDFQLWNQSYTQKVEKEKQSLSPSSRQPEEDLPQSLDQALESASTLEEKEKLLSEHMGYNPFPTKRSDKYERKIGI